MWMHQKIDVRRQEKIFETNLPFGPTILLTPLYFVMSQIPMYGRNETVSVTIPYLFGCEILKISLSIAILSFLCFGRPLFALLGGEIRSSPLLTEWKFESKVLSSSTCNRSATSDLDELNWMSIESEYPCSLYFLINLEASTAKVRNLCDKSRNYGNVIIVHW